MFKYTNEGGDINIVPSVNEVPNSELIEQTAKLTHNKLTYSDGWILETKVTPTKIEFRSNRELIKKDDGKYHPKA